MQQHFPASKLDNLVRLANMNVEVVLQNTDQVLSCHNRIGGFVSECCHSKLSPNNTGGESLRPLMTEHCLGPASGRFIMSFLVAPLQLEIVIYLSSLQTPHVFRYVIL